MSSYHEFPCFNAIARLFWCFFFFLFPSSSPPFLSLFLFQIRCRFRPWQKPIASQAAASQYCYKVVHMYIRKRELLRDITSTNMKKRKGEIASSLELSVVFDAEGALRLREKKKRLRGKALLFISFFYLAFRTNRVRVGDDRRTFQYTCRGVPDRSYDIEKYKGSH